MLLIVEGRLLIEKDNQAFSIVDYTAKILSAEALTILSSGFYVNY